MRDKEDEGDEGGEGDEGNEGTAVRPPAVPAARLLVSSVGSYQL